MRTILITAILLFLKAALEQARILLFGAAKTRALQRNCLSEVACPVRAIEAARSDASLKPSSPSLSVLIKSSIIGTISFGSLI